MRSRFAGNLCIGALVLALCLPLQAEPTPEAISAAKQLNEQVRQLYSEGRYQEALPIAVRAVQEFDKTLGGKHAETTLALVLLGLIHYGEGAYAKAEPILKRVLAIREEVLGVEHPLTAVALNNLGGLYSGMGEFTKAKPLHQRALAIREKVLGAEHPDTAISLFGLGLIYKGLGALAEAESVLQQALAIQEKVLGAEHLATGATLTMLADTKLRNGAYSEAESMFRRALAIGEKTQGPEHVRTADAMHNLGMLYSSIGEYKQAERWYRRALPVFEATLGPGNPTTAGCLNGLGIVLRETGAYAQAESLFQRALATHENTLGVEHPRTLQLLINLAILYKVTGAYAKAEPLYQRAISVSEKVSGPEHPETATYIDSLGNLYLEMQAYAQAEPLLLRGLAIREKVLGRKHPNTALSLNNLASVYRQTGAYARAEPLYRRALAIRTQELGPEHSFTADTLNDLAGMYYASGEYARARPLYRRALAIREQALDPDHPDTSETLSNLAVLDWAAGAPAKALPLLQRTQRIESKNSDRFLLSGSEARKQDYLRGLAKSTARNASFSVALRTPQSAALGLASVLQFKGRVLDAISDSVARLRQSVAPEDRTLFEQLSQVVNQISTLVYREPDQPLDKRQRERLKQLSSQQEALEAELASRSSNFRRQIAPITVREVSRAVPADAVLVEWFRYLPFDPKRGPLATASGEARYVAYVLERERDPVAIDLGEAAEIDRLVSDFRAATSNPQRSDVKDRAIALSSRLIQPLRAHLDARQHLLVSPDGALNLLPMTALVDEQGEYLAKRFDITYLTSGRDLLRLATAEKPRGEAVVIADPSYGEAGVVLAQSAATDAAQRSPDLDRGGLRFRPLPATALEAQAIKQLLNLKDANLFMRADATETRLKQLQGPRILHVATHGFFLNDLQRAGTTPLPRRIVPPRENPLLRSGLAFAGANVRSSGTNDDGILTALEAAQLDLSGTELVVLSACESGVGEVLNSEGVYGLRRALVLAGAQTQITSLWRVADEPTHVLMADYYQRLLRGKGRSSALRDAQNALLATTGYSHPYYWAGFILIGQWQPLQGQR